jgi:hypothetical protein
MILSFVQIMIILNGFLQINYCEFIFVNFHFPWAISLSSFFYFDILHDWLVIQISYYFDCR